MTRIAFVTWSGLPALAPDDRLAADELRRRGHEVFAVSWDDAGFDAAGCDAVILRSCWDYHLRHTEFVAWLNSTERSAACLWNPAPLARWNTHKGYLVELADAGCPVVPTMILPRGDDRDLGALLRERGWADAVLKPAVGASAFGARRISPANAASDGVRQWRAAHDMLVQPFMEEIADHGEWSLIFIDGEFSHAVHKHPAGGDFRVQHELGGSMAAHTPPPSALPVAEKAIRLIPGGWLFARTDLVETASGFLLMELELIEPSLFLDQADDAPGRFADAIERVARG